MRASWDRRDDPASSAAVRVPATQASIVAVVRRGPSDWAHVGAWRTDTDAYEAGAWLRGTIYPQKCDLAPDGRWFAYSAMKRPGDWPAGAVYEAVSRLPWLKALAAWVSGTTYTRGIHFAAVGETDLGLPDVGDSKLLLQRYGLRVTPPNQFAVERRRGWVESPDTPPRDQGGPWDEHRDVEMTKQQPGGFRQLHVTGTYAAFRSADPDVDSPMYWLTDERDEIALADAQWADWDRSGDLLVATTSGLLQRRVTATGIVKEVADLSDLKPRPQPAPGWASDW